jgi:hypothetical protein
MPNESHSITALLVPVSRYQFHYSGFKEQSKLERTHLSFITSGFSLYRFFSSFASNKTAYGKVS